MSGEELVALASPNFGAVELTFENTTAEWRRIRKVSLDYGGAVRNQFVSVPSGDDIRAWYDATLQRNQIQATNRELALGVVALAGMTVAIASNRPGAARTLGGLAVLGAGAAAQIDDAKNAVSAAEHVALFPDSHLFAGPFSIPPNLFAKKWVLLNTKSAQNQPCIDWFVLTYEFEDLAFERVYLKYKDSSEWQREACERRTRGGRWPVDSG